MQVQFRYNNTQRLSATTGTYYIRSEFATGCFTVKSVLVTVNPLPTLTTVVNPAAVCSPSTVDITKIPFKLQIREQLLNIILTLALANGRASDVTTAAATSEPIISEVNLLLDALL
jgi:hypothetical protein